MLGRPLLGLRRIDMTTATPEALLKECLLESASAVGQLVDETTSIATAFRSRDVGAARDKLAWLAHELGQLMVLVRTLDDQLGLAASQLDAETPASDALSHFGTLLETLVQAQRSGDHFQVADILEYDLSPHLRRWQVRFESLAA